MQAISETSTVTLEAVVSPMAGYIAIHTALPDGSVDAGSVVGLTAPGAIAAGVNLLVEVTVDVASSTTKLFAMLHQDATADGGAYDPANDTPLGLNDLYNPSFMVGVVVQDQGVAAADGMVHLDFVASPTAGYIAIHNSLPDGSVDAATVVGLTAPGEIAAGVNTDVSVAIDMAACTQTLYAMLHQDAVADGGAYDPAADTPVGINDVYNPMFKVGFVKVADQAVTGGTVTIERVSAIGTAGYIAIHNSLPDGSVDAGTVVGLTAPGEVAAGMNEAVVVTVDEDAATAVLFAMLHQDAVADGGAYNPAADTPLGINDAYNPMFRAGVVVADQVCRLRPFQMEMFVVSFASFFIYEKQFYSNARRQLSPYKN